MTLIEAIKSGRSFRRNGWDDMQWIDKACNADICFQGEGHARQFTPDEVCATDWEILELTVTVTKKQIDDAFLEIVHWIASKRRRFFRSNESAHAAFARGYAKLGLGDAP